MKIFLKILLIGVGTTVARILCQLLIPDTGQNILPQSQFVLDGSLPIYFLIYGVLVYSLLTALFLPVKDKVSGLKYSLALIPIWIVYLLEPLPHAKSFLLDNLAYILADSIALLIMGLMIRKLLPTGNQIVVAKGSSPEAKIVIPITTLIFVFGRLIQYRFLGIYSSFDAKPLLTIVWCILVGGVSACVITWFAKRNTIWLALAIFVVNLILFNGFMVLVFDMSTQHLGWWDLVFRTVIDSVAISIGMVGTWIIKR